MHSIFYAILNIFNTLIRKYIMTLPIKAFLSHFLKATQNSWKLALIKKWESIMGTLAQHITIEKIYDDTIILGVYDSCWMQEMHILSSTILETINQNLDQPRLKQVRFKLVARSTAKKQKEKAVYVQKKERPVIFADHEKKALNAISDHALRKTLEAFLVRCHRERE